MSNIQVLVVMGSDSDFAMMEPCFKLLKKFMIPYEAHVCSAHRSPVKAAELAAKARERGIGVVIAAAGLAAHLPGVLASYTTLPVIGVPSKTGALDGVDALYSIVQMPAGVPVATVSIDGSANAAILAAQILSLNDETLSERLISYKNELEMSVELRNERLAEKLSTIGE